MDGVVFGETSFLFISCHLYLLRFTLVGLAVDGIFSTGFSSLDFTPSYSLPEFKFGDFLFAWALD